MCDLDRVSGFLIAAKVAYLASLVLLAIGIANSVSFFAAAANVPLMVGVILAVALATAMYTAALVELDRCATGPCASELSELRNTLVALLSTMAVFTAALFALALVAAIPFAGSLAIGAVLALFSGFTMLVSAGLEGTFARAVQSYNDCRARAGTSTLSVFVIVLAIIAAIAATSLTVGFGIAGKIPWQVII
jgi:uncharacterized membrane protein